MKKRFEIEIDEGDICWIRDLDVRKFADNETPYVFCNAFDSEAEGRPCYGMLNKRPKWCPLKEVKESQNFEGPFHTGGDWPR